MLQQGAGIARLVAVVRKGRNWHIIPSISISTLPYIIQCSARHEHHLPHQSPSPRVFSTNFFPYLVIHVSDICCEWIESPSFSFISLQSQHFASIQNELLSVRRRQSCSHAACGSYWSDNI